MNWARANRFLAGFLGALLVGVAVLGFLIFSAYDRYTEASARLDQQTNELKRLQKLAPYPDEENRKRYDDQRKRYAEAVTALQAQLAAGSPGPENISATDFQSRLRDVVAGVINFARQNNVTLPPDFYLGFEQYRASVPTAAATPLLAMQLKSSEQIARILIAQKIETLTVFKRAPLPQENTGFDSTPGATPDAPPAGGGPRGGAGGRGAPPAAPLVMTYPLQIEFRALPVPQRAVLDELTKAQPFYVIRALRVKNERDKGPGRGAQASSADDLNPPAAPTPAAPAPATAPGARPNLAGAVPEPPLPDRATLRYIVGTERLDTALRLELVRFSPPQ